MKSSIYNISAPIEKSGVLVYNSLSKGFIYLSRGMWERCFDKNSSVIIENLSSQEFELLKHNRFIVEDSFDEYSNALAIKMATRLHKRTYNVIINPTLDCNLGCWYCYESHIKGSRISKNTIDAICNHLKLKYTEDRYKSLSLSFFGGEPMLGTNQVIEIIDRVNAFCNKEGILLNIGFTTNGTILPSRLLTSLHDKKVTFQITLDGTKEQHNFVRHFKNAPISDSYDIIWKNIGRLFDNIPNMQLCLRINFDDNTFRDYKDLVQKILSLDKEKLTVSIQKVWQVDASSIDYEKVFNFIEQLQEEKVNVSFLDFSRGETTCYADKLNSIVVNYDGNVYKCTARNFSEDGRLGEIQEDGAILWNYERLGKHCFCTTPSKCQKCKLFPSCPGICSQKIIESGDEAPCYISKPFSIEDYVLYNYKLKTLQTK